MRDTSTAPWSLFVADGGVEVHLTNSRQQSPHGAVAGEFEPAAPDPWSGSKRGVCSISGRASDYGVAGESEPPSSCVIGSIAPPGMVELAVRWRSPCAGPRGAMLDVTKTFGPRPSGMGGTCWFPCHAWPRGADLKVGSPLCVEASGKFGVTISEVRLRAAGGRRVRRRQTL